MSTPDLNAVFRDYALMFLARMPVDEDIPFAENLDRTSLDGSIESLAVVDDYLAFVHENLKHLSDAEYNNLVLRCGGYIGECIRMTWPDFYNWTDYNDYVPGRPKLRDLMPERNLGNCAFLARKPDKMIMPLNKVLRFLHEGPENSVLYFAQCERRYHL